MTIPNSRGQKGNAIAAAMGAMIAKSCSRLAILKGTTPDTVEKAKQFIDGGHLTYRCKEDEKHFHVEVQAYGRKSRVHCIVSEGHTNITYLEKDGQSIKEVNPHAVRDSSGYSGYQKFCPK